MFLELASKRKMELIWSLLKNQEAKINAINTICLAISSTLVKVKTTYAAIFWQGKLPAKPRPDRSNATSRELNTYPANKS
jgi:hypothetical protein